MEDRQCVVAKPAKDRRPIAIMGKDSCHVRKRIRYTIAFAVNIGICAIAIMLAAVASTLAQDTKVTTEDVTFTSGTLQLKGTLFLPQSQKPVPAVVLLHGSGETKRADNFYYAAMFARHGIAALTYDKRGVGESQGNPQAWRWFSYEALASDAAAGVSFLQNLKTIDAHRVGLFGASQGGAIAPIAVTKSKNVAFVVQLSAQMTTIGSDMIFDRANRLRREGFNGQDLAEVREMQLVDFDVTRGKRFDEFKALWEKYKTRKWFPRVYLTPTPNGIDHPYRRWERTVLDYEPGSVLLKVDTPMIWLYGDPEFDTHLDVKVCMERVEALRRAGKKYEVRMFTGTDHNLELVRDKTSDAVWEKYLFDWLTKVLVRD